MRESLLEQIKERGYWRVNFRPTVHRKAIATLEDCRRLVATSSVEKRGWDYPHVSTRNDEQGGTELHDGFVQVWTDWQNHREFWRMYQSGQFLHYLALREDWLERDEWYRQGSTPPARYPEDKYVSILGLNWQITEMFELLSRIAKQGIYDDGVEVSITLHGTAQRKLQVDPGKIPFSVARTTSTASISASKRYSREEIAEPREIALSVIAEFYDRFGWNPAIDQLRSMQDELYALNIGRG